ncbi:sugar phosphate isomerase/epimerase family protein [Thalassoroseus pseudoceratinae]|uniref:sugar phosphate isomerase/epimerase family protein n=1 Tax=Thalassoroseus pseudoceratinae TaxID=2713176 RepID=UPI001421322E|nr:sugar phosphate isomerase/epimerase family protein [Thalassoroseus pseudoceratinae]
MNSADSRISVDRRHFLSALAGAGAVAALAPQTASAKEPKSASGSHMKLSLAAYSFNRQLRKGGSDPQMTLSDFIDFCAELGLDGTELTSYYFPSKVTNEYLMMLKNRTFRQGLDISGTAIGNDFALPDGEARQKQLAMTRQWIDYAAAMGAPVIRIFAGKTPKGDNEAEAIKRCAAGINESLEYAAEKGVLLALENHGGITATPKQMLSIIEQVDESPWFGVNFDSGNFRTDDPYRDLAKIAPLAVNAQIKVMVAPNGGGKQPADLPRIISILKDAGYRGYVVLEFEEQNPREEIPKFIDQLAELIQKP